VFELLLLFRGDRLPVEEEEWWLSLWVEVDDEWLEWDDISLLIVDC
jgi:hypothetical protein